MLVNISEAALLGMYSLTVLYKNRDNPLRVKEISSILGASENHVSKIMQRLQKAGWVNAIRGPKGGYTINGNLSNITMLDVYELFDGKLVIKNCPMGRKKCPFTKCIFNPVISKFYIEFRNYLKNINASNIDKINLRNDENNIFYKKDTNLKEGDNYEFYKRK